jgi:xanthine dehydrogenase YagS FAD-binding subunit
MTMKRFEHANATNLEDVLEVLDEQSRPLAGGTDLMGLMKERIIAPDRLVNLKTLPGLDGIEQKDNGWHIGAMTTLSQLTAAIRGRPELAVLYEALSTTASPQLRNMATIGGNLLQRPRCSYFRNPLTHCWLKGGETCFAVEGENKYHAILGGDPCYIVHPSDPGAALVALEASVTLTGPVEERRVAVADFFQPPQQERRSETALETDELITSVFIPLPEANSRGTYVKVMERALWDFALVSVAVQLVFEGSAVRKARVVLGGVAPVPWRTKEAEAALVGQTLTPAIIEEAAQASTVGAEPLSQNGYKVDLAQAVVREALRLQHQAAEAEA